MFIGGVPPMRSAGKPIVASSAVITRSQLSARSVPPGEAVAMHLGDDRHRRVPDPRPASGHGKGFDRPARQRGRVCLSRGFGRCADVIARAKVRTRTTDDHGVNGFVARAGFDRCD
jgi:hypothetical protein